MTPSLREQLQQRLNTLRKRVERRHQAALQDLKRVEEAPLLAYEAELLKTATQRIKLYDSSVSIVDYATGAARIIALQPGQPIQKQIAQRFKQAKRMENAAEQVLARLAVVEHQQQQLARFEQELAALPDDALERFSSKLPPAHLPKKKMDPTAPTELPYRVVTASTGRAIWVGRGAKKNDELTFKHASPHAAWLHASGFAGAHVVVPKRRDEKLDTVTEREAGLLAAHHSKAPQGPVEILITEVKFVRKPKGAKAGSVITSRERHLVVDNTPEQKRALLHRSLT